ncbi:MAG: LamG domain-containing protein [Thermofilaceae archaeon]
MSSARRILRAGGLWFDGMDDYAALSGFRYPEMTLLMWVNPDYQLPGAFQASKDIVRKGDEWGVTTVPTFNTNGRLSINLRYFGASVQWVYPVTPLSILRWNFVAVVWRMPAGTVTTYINGVKEVFSPGSGNMWTDTLPLRIAYGYAGYFKGIIDKVHVYNRALSDDEIKAIYERGALIRDGLVLLLDFSEYEGNIAYDKSGCGNHATLYGARWVVKKALYRM